WTPPCLSLGYAQSMGDVDLHRLAASGFDLVRRSTGGRAILHTDELTYSIITPQTDPRVAGGIVESYRRLSEGLVRGLALLGAKTRNDRVFTAENAERKEREREREKEKEGSALSANSAVKDNPVCFVSPSKYEITANGKKLIGSAQARKRGVVLQHGSLPLTGDIARICDVLIYADEAARRAAKEQVRARATTLESALARAVSWQEAAEAMKEGFAETLTLDLEPAPLTEEEMAKAKETPYFVFASFAPLR
ncbi:MAG: biotin/lipoate A/B protein ligase family protein, partial [Chloroflexota bacterium]